MTQILVVDDMAVFREPIAAALRTRGWGTLVASDGMQALGLLRSQPVDLVLLDVAMPGLDGLGVLAAMRGEPALAALPVILLTAVSERDYIVRAAAMGVRDYLLKSQFSLAELVQRIERRLAAALPTPAAPAGAAPIVAAPSPPPAAPPACPAPAPLPAPCPPAPTLPAPGSPPRGTAPAPVARPPASPSSPAGAHDAEDPDQRLQELKPLVTRSEIGQLLESCGELKALSPTVLRVLDYTAHPGCSMDKVTRMIRQDHALALKMLKLANSAIYSRGERVESVHKAVMRIGLNQIRQAVMNIGVVERFSADQGSRGLSLPMFWEHSIATGLIAADLARRLDWPESAIDTAFTMGLLHDVGRLVYTEVLGDRYRQVLRAAERLQLPLEQVETRMLLVNHADAMDRLLRAWRFPPDLINPIALHHLSVGNVRRICPSAVASASLLAAANRIAHALLLGHSGNVTLYPLEEFAAALRLPPTTLDDLAAAIPAQTDDMKFALLAAGNQSAWPQLHRELQQALDFPFHPLHLAADPGANLYRLACDRLGRDAGAQRPNLAIVHLTDARQRAPLAEQLASLEAAGGCGPLPVLVLSPGGRLRLPERTMAGRRGRCLPSPVTVARLLQTCREVVAFNPHGAAAPARALPSAA